MLSERLIKNPDDAGDRPKRNNHGGNGSELRSRAGGVPRQRSHQLDRILNIRRGRAGDSGMEVSLSSAAMAHSNHDLYMAVPMDMGADNSSRKPQNRHVLFVVFDRVLDHLSHKENILTTVNYIALTVLLVQLTRAIIAVDVGNAAITLAVGSVSLIIYLLSERAKKREAYQRRLDTTSDRVFELADKERQRADEASRHLRDEERAFQREQITRLTARVVEAERRFENARQRSHAYNNALNGIVLAHRRLIELYEDAGGAQIPNLLKADRILDDLWKRIDKLNAEESNDEDFTFRRSGDQRSIIDRDENKS